MLRIITLNLNGIRSASSKGFFDWLAQQDADIVCVQELKAQVGDLSADMLTGRAVRYFHYAEKKGYSGVGLYGANARARHRGTRHSRLRCRGPLPRADWFGAVGGISSTCRPVHRRRAPGGEIPLHGGLLAPPETLRAGSSRPRSRDLRRLEHRPPEIDLKNWKGNLKNSGFPAGGARLDPRGGPNRAG